MGEKERKRERKEGERKEGVGWKDKRKQQSREGLEKVERYFIIALLNDA